MKKQIVALLGAMFLISTAPANAQGYNYQPDPRVLGTLNDMIYTLGLYCQNGNQQACGSANYIQQFGGQMLQAGAACQSGNQQACFMYQQAYQDLGYGYQSLQNEIAQTQMMQAPAGYGSTHQQRMQAIQDFSAQNTANWNARQAANDLNHQNFVNQINQ